MGFDFLMKEDILVDCSVTKKELQKEMLLVFKTRVHLFHTKVHARSEHFKFLVFVIMLIFCLFKNFLSLSVVFFYVSA